MFNSNEKEILKKMQENRIRCCKCGTLGNNNNDLIDISTKKEIKAICERCYGQ